MLNAARNIALAVGVLSGLYALTLLNKDKQLLEVLGLPENIRRAFLIASVRYNVPLLLLLAVGKRESQFNPSATGAAGEIGLMQIMPATARALDYTGPLDDLYEPIKNINLGAKLLGQISKDYEEPRDIYAVYNSGRPFIMAPDITRNVNVPAFLQELQLLRNTQLTL